MRRFFEKLKIRDFRLFQDKTLFIGKYVTAIVGANATGKSTLLALLANSSRLKKEDILMIKEGDGRTITGRPFQAKFSDILKANPKYHPKISNAATIFTSPQEGDYIREIRTYWTNNETRLKVLNESKPPQEIHSQKFELPVLYLGLSRLYPLGEVEKDTDVQAQSLELTSEEKQWFDKEFASLLCMSQKDMEDFEHNSTTFKGYRKTGVGITTATYDYLSNSAGQDNIGQILLALLSFRRLKNSLPVWRGGLLLIDELDATLHPYAQEKLLELFISEARNTEMQIVFTTHSFTLIKEICKKTQYNKNESVNNIELCHIDNSNKRLEFDRNSDFEKIEALQLRKTKDLPSSSSKKPLVLVEDKEAEWFLNKLVTKSPKDYRIPRGCCFGHNTLISLFKNAPIFSHLVSVVFDGDVEDSTIKKVKDLNYLKLPLKGKSPEQVFFEYLTTLTKDNQHTVWDNAHHYTISVHECEIEKIEAPKDPNEKDRDLYKRWFKKYKKVLEDMKLYNSWKKAHKKEVADFNTRWDVFIKKAKEKI
jgi:AAA15 family ATPase/GTPase